MKVFISYYRRTGWFAASIVEQWLKDASIEAVMDQKHFRWTKELPKEIESQIEDCDVLLVILSHGYYTSDWTKQEINLATQYKKHIYYVAIGKDAVGRNLRAKIPPGFTKNSEDLPLNLPDREVGRWRNLLLDLLQGLIKTGQVKDHDERFTVWFSKMVKCNEWVREAVARENIENSLHASSCVELAHTMKGWTEEDIFVHRLEPYRLEPEVQEYLSNQGKRGDYPPIADDKMPDNWALASLNDQLSDTKYLELYFQAVPHILVRQVADNFEALYYYRDEAQRPRLFDPGHLTFPHAVVPSLVLVSRDDYLLIGQRAANVRFYENHWSATYEEHMRISLDDHNPFHTALRGLREELVGEDKASVTEAIRFFSVFRELDHWENVSKGQTFWVMNVGLAGMIRVNLSAGEILTHWLRRKDKGSGGRFSQDPEFQHLVAIPYTFENLLRLVTEDTFNPATFPDLLAPTGVNREFPEIASNPRLQRQHPSNKIRLIRCLTGKERFRYSLREKIQVELSSKKRADATEL